MWPLNIEPSLPYVWLARLPICLGNPNCVHPSPPSGDCAYKTGTKETALLSHRIWYDSCVGRSGKILPKTMWEGILQRISSNFEEKKQKQKTAHHRDRPTIFIAQLMKKMFLRFENIAQASDSLGLRLFNLEIIRNSSHNNMPSETFVCTRRHNYPVARDQPLSRDAAEDCFYEMCLFDNLSWNLK